jgi:hypothetical protein
MALNLNFQSQNAFSPAVLLNLATIDLRLKLNR